MLDIRERLAANLYRSALDADPETVVALRITHGSGLVWRIDDQVLTVTIGNAPPLTFPLTGTIGALATSLAAKGVTVTYADSDVLNLASGILISGEGDGSVNTKLMAFRSDLWTLLDAYGVEVRDAERNVEQAIEQLYMESAEGEILDFWGSFFAVPRDTGEQDGPYFNRIIAEVERPRSNVYAIEQTIKDLTGHSVTLREPWREIFTLDSSELSGDHAFQDGSFFTWNVFQPIYPSSLSEDDLAKVLAIIERNRPIGTVIIEGFPKPPIGYAKASFAWQARSNIVYVLNAGSSNYQTDVMSSSLAMSDGVEDLGSFFKWTEQGNIVRTFGADPLDLFASPGPWTGGWDSRRWVRSSIVSVVTRHYG